MCGWFLFSHGEKMFDFFFLPFQWEWVCRSHAVPSNLNGRFFSSSSSLVKLWRDTKKGRRRKAGNLRNLHAISTQKKLLGDPTVYVPPFIFTCDGVQLTRERKRKGAKMCDGPTTTSTLLAVQERSALIHYAIASWQIVTGCNLLASILVAS